MFSSAALSTIFYFTSNFLSIPVTRAQYGASRIEFYENEMF